MIFISLGRFKKKPTKEMTAQVSKMMEDAKKRGIKILGFYWTLGRFDSVLVFDAPSEKDALKSSIGVADFVSVETLVAIPREEAIKLL